MRIVIVGAGTIGVNLARYLSAENHEIYVVEEDQKKAAQIDEKLDVKVYAGNGSDPEVLKLAGVEAAELVVAVTASDESNLVVCALAHSLGAQRTIARVRNTPLGRTLGEVGYENFHIDEIINPEDVAAKAIVKTIQTPGAREVADFVDGRILLRAFDIPQSSPLCNIRLDELRDEDFPWPFLIVAIARDHEIVIAKGDVSISPEDRVYVLLPEASLGEFLTFVNPEIRKTNKVVIYGATDMGLRVATALSEEINDIILVEDDPHLARQAADQLSATRIIQGSGAQTDILKECGIEAADVFVATTLNDHSNLVSAVLAKRLGAKNTIISTQEPDYMTIVEDLNIDVIINPRLLAVDQILRQVRGKGIRAVTKLLECDAEALELVPEENAPVTRGPLKDIRFPKNAIVGAVCRENDVFLAKGDTHIRAGERVIVFSQESAVQKVQALFTKKKIF